MKKVIIIGGGIAGLTAGVYLQKAGFTTEIYEKNRIAGGQCTGWRREGYFIDNCIHWLTGTREGSDLNDLWKEVGALGEGIEFYKKDQFFSAELDGKKITFWRDLERTREEMLQLSPEDAKEINQLIEYIKLAESMTIPVDKPFDMMGPLETFRMAASMADMGKLMKEYGGIDLTQLADRFKHPLLSLALKEYMPPGYQAYSFLVSYATITGGNGDIPKGGSLEMVMRMVKHYQELGGVLHTDAAVEQVMINGKMAEGVVLAEGKNVIADYVVCACDTDFTFSRLLDREYMPKPLRTFYEERTLYPVVSGFSVAFGVEGIYEELHGTQMFGCRPLVAGTSHMERMSINTYDHEPDFAPAGNTVVQSSYVQTEEDYCYWTDLYHNKEEYNKKKWALAEEMRQRFVEKYPFLKEKVRVLDAWTPVTYHHYCNAYRGAYMSFIITKEGKSKIIPGKIKGLDNVLLASQWQMAPGGLPGAAAMGKFAAMRIMKKEKIR